MRRFVLAALILGNLRAGGCGTRDDPTRAAPSATHRTAAPAPNAPFKVVDLFDMERRAISRFSYCKSTQELFVSFDRPRHAEDVLYQWSVAKARLVSTYSLEKGFMVDDLSPSPDGRRLVVALYRTDDGASSHSEKYALLDTTSHKVLSGDLGIYDERRANVDFGASGERFRVTVTPAMGGPDRKLFYDASGRTVAEAPSDFPQKKEKGKVWVIESSKETFSTHGLYYTDEGGQDYRIAPDHWNGNYDITKDGQYVVTTTWDGEILAFSTALKSVVFRQKIADHYGYLAYDDKGDRFLIGDAMGNGTTYLRALVRVR